MRAPRRRCRLAFMVGAVLASVAAVLVAAWGLSHLVPTGKVIASFGAISLDSRRVLTMEWVAEGVTMVFVGALVGAALAFFGAGGAATRFVERGSACLLVAIGVLTAFTGARTPVVWFKACPVVMLVAATLLLTASFA